MTDFDKRKKVYEYLCSKGVPEALAEMMAARCQMENSPWNKRPWENAFVSYWLLYGAFKWGKTPEGVEFWDHIHSELKERKL